MMVFQVRNALFYFDDCHRVDAIEQKKKIKTKAPTLRFEAPTEHWDSFRQKYKEMGGIVLRCLLRKGQVFTFITMSCQCHWQIGFHFYP